jgi:hypothetical protein
MEAVMDDDRTRLEGLISALEQRFSDLEDEDLTPEEVGQLRTQLDDAYTQVDGSDLSDEDIDDLMDRLDDLQDVLDDLAGDDWDDDEDDEDSDEDEEDDDDEDD